MTRRMGILTDTTLLKCNKCCYLYKSSVLII